MHEISLYQISQKFIDLENKLIESGGEIDEEKELILKEITELLQTKVDGCVGFVQRQNDVLSAIDGRIDYLNGIKAARKKALERFSGYVVSCMDHMKVVKLEGELSKITIRKPAKVVMITNEDDLPIDCLNIQTITTKKPDKKLIKQKLEAGEEIPGAKIIEGARNPIFK